MTVQLRAVGGTLPALQGKFLVVDTLSDGYTGTFAGHYNYEVLYKDEEYQIYPTFWNETDKAFVHSDEMVVYTKENQVFFVDRTTSDPYNPAVVDSFVIEEGMDKDKRTLQAFKRFADSLFRIGNYNLFIASGVSEADSPNFARVEKVELDKASGTVTIGATVELEAVISPSNAQIKDVTFTITDDTIGTLTQTGNKAKIVTKKVGTTTVTVETVDGAHTDTYTLTVEPVKVTSVSLDKTTLTLEVGAKATLVATVLPANAQNKAVTFSATGSSVTVTNAGEVTGASAGESDVTVKTTDGGFTATCKVTVTEPPAPDPEPEPEPETP